MGDDKLKRLERVVLNLRERKGDLILDVEKAGVSGVVCSYLGAEGREDYEMERFEAQVERYKITRRYNKFRRALLYHKVYNYMIEIMGLLRKS